MLRERRFGGKCVDINSLMVGLCRSVGIPAREVYGLRLANSTQFRSLGRSGDVTGAQHCRAEIYLEHQGWFAVDPADVRKAVLEEKLPIDSAPIKGLTERLFGAWEANWAGYNSAGGIALSGAPHRPPFRFLMYPCAMTKESVAACVDAAKFVYRITSVEATA
jgi:transglutaminase-like putative cysteine protease